MTKVIFKKRPLEVDRSGVYGWGVIVLFPDMKNWEYIWSYEHLWQHSDASPDLLDELENATPEEYNDLLKELVSIWYDDLIILN